MVIKPTVGRKVWFHRSTNEDYMNVLDINQPLDATVVFVHNDTLVNLYVIDHMGHPHSVNNVHLSQPDETIIPGDRAYCEWMPYQINQSQKQSM